MNAPPIKPPEQRTEHPDFWCKRFGEGVTPWDAGHAPAAFAQFIARQPTPLNTLIPGCGSAWDAAHLATLGWPVTALDFSPKAVEAARAVLGDAPVNLVCADFFTFTPAAPYALIYERAFLCALPRKLWADWGRRVAEPVSYTHLDVYKRQVVICQPGNRLGQRLRVAGRGNFEQRENQWNTTGGGNGLGQRRRLCLRPGDHNGSASERAVLAHLQ